MGRGSVSWLCLVSSVMFSVSGGQWVFSSRSSVGRRQNRSRRMRPRADRSQSTSTHWCQDLVLCKSWSRNQSPLIAELHRRSSKILEERSVKRLLQVGNLYKLSTTLGLEPVSIVNYTRPGSRIKWPTPNKFATQHHVSWPVLSPKVATKSWIQYQCFPPNLRRIVIATLNKSPLIVKTFSEFESYHEVIFVYEARNLKDQDVLTRIGGTEHSACVLKVELEFLTFLNCSK